MTDKELSAFGEKLYEGILVTPLPAGMVFAIATAIRQGVPWGRLPPPLKLAIFKIAAHCAPTQADDAQSVGEAAEPPARAHPAPVTRAVAWESVTPGAEPQTPMDEAPSAPIEVRPHAGQAAAADPNPPREDDDEQE